MTDDVKIDYDALAEEAFATAKLLLGTLKKLREFKRKLNCVPDFLNKMKRNKEAIDNIDNNFNDMLKDIAALYFELKDKE